MGSAKLFPLLLATLGVLLAPASIASEANLEAPSLDSPPCFLPTQLACFHEDCSEALGCRRLFCPVYVRHASHAAGHGCTPA